ncbi:PLP-dependent cysteine synthase family protein [Microtetraspora sp. NBRC 16547]|uniref:PLP-dependent cysteine synthase family protein n=1 Tax=Microtetraspora sp. NBRC 16547 TaxID=3030993 RepID=UPI0024A02C7D|nr:PLP-dependent cysteine synthase family protein [Microtetraspora sp. NBRC 16547]GLX00217.1 cysteine synthase [Microtetraspora sp. NBRC 16547]
MKYVERHDPDTRRWAAEAIQAVEADANRSCDTHLHVFPLPPHWGVDLYLKDESVHPTGSLKHRLARSLFLYGLANGWIGPKTTIIESSSGSTAVSEAYFARLLGLPFIAVIPASTSPEKREIIEFHGGKCHLVDDPRAIYAESRRLAEETGGHYMDQFTYAERATDWRGNNNIAESIFNQMALERHPEPAWIVVSAGTGGTSATIGRYIRYRRHQTRLCVADPEGSAFYPSWVAREEQVGTGSRIEGIGRPRVEPSFMPAVIDRMTQVPDALSIAAMRWVKEVTRLDVGGSTGTNVAAAVQIIKEMRAAGERGSVVTLICDGGERYRDTYGDDGWLTRQGLDIDPHLNDLRGFLTSDPLAQ